MNVTAPACVAIAIVCPSGLIAAADGAAGTGVIAAQLSRRSLWAPKNRDGPGVGDGNACTGVRQAHREHCGIVDPGGRQQPPARQDQRARNVARGS
jgi:hypothetical protein